VHVNAIRRYAVQGTGLKTIVAPSTVFVIADLVDLTFERNVGMIMIGKDAFLDCPLRIMVFLCQGNVELNISMCKGES
jgi:hypothetical protein